MDGHSSRKKPEMLQKYLEHKIYVKTYVAHASNLMQVLDRGLFRAFKTSITTGKAYKSFTSRAEWRNEMLGTLLVP